MLTVLHLRIQQVNAKLRPINKRPRTCLSLQAWKSSGLKRAGLVFCYVFTKLLLGHNSLSNQKHVHHASQHYVFFSTLDTENNLSKTLLMDV